jgi:Ser/Thr protein kinase RdoA (MazF antagonist)
MNNYFPVINSTLSAVALAKQTQSNYDLEPIEKCRLLQIGLNDTYLLNCTGDKSYILRAYRCGWRTLEEVLYEVDVLLHLKDKGVPISIPLPGIDGNYVNVLEAPEGSRFTILFSFAPGNEPTYDKEEEAVQYGKAVAKIHEATDGFQSRHPRFSIDTDHLIDSPLKTIRPFLMNRVQDWEYIKELGQKLKSGLFDIPHGALEKGFCHGDLHGWNAGISVNGTITLYDFDCCGSGWRAYDMAVFRWSARIREKELQRWTAYLLGYQSVRKLNSVDLEATSLFVGIRHIWMMGVHTSIADAFGLNWVNDAYFNLQLNFLHKWEKDYEKQQERPKKSLEIDIY